jgi:Ohr subfamily peroxiredoxin
MIGTMSIEAIYTAESTATGGGRDGNVKSTDGLLDLQTRPPKAMGGSGEGVNPELLFSAGYAACFLGALRLVAKTNGVALDDATGVTVRVGIGRDETGRDETGRGETGYGLTIEVIGYLPGLEQAHAEDLMHKANQVCPYSKATRGNVESRVLTKTL